MEYKLKPDEIKIIESGDVDEAATTLLSITELAWCDLVDEHAEAAGAKGQTVQELLKANPQQHAQDMVKLKAQMWKELDRCDLSEKRLGKLITAILAHGSGFYAYLCGAQSTPENDK